MKLHFKNFGAISDGEIELKNFTLLCGPNSSGKTYVSYAIHSLCSQFNSLAPAPIALELAQDFVKNGSITIDIENFRPSIPLMSANAEKAFIRQAPSFFSVESDFFSDASISIDISNDVPTKEVLFETQFFLESNFFVVAKERKSSSIVITALNKQGIPPASIMRMEIAKVVSSVLFGYAIQRPFAITSERTGVVLFYKDLDINRNMLFDKLVSSKKKLDPFELYLEHSSRYAAPIKENIDIVRDYQAISKQKSFFYEDKDQYKRILDLAEELIGGGFKGSSKELSYEVRSHRGKKKIKIPLYATSSAVKSLFLLDVFIRHIARPGQILIFDEPELNLHPENQRKIAELLMLISNAGVSVFVTTHSDYFVRELSARLMIGARDDGAEKYNLEAASVCRPEHISAFETTQAGRIKRMEVSVDGIDMTTLNAAIGSANDFFDGARFS